MWNAGLGKNKFCSRGVIIYVITYAGIASRRLICRALEIARSARRSLIGAGLIATLSNPKGRLMRRVNCSQVGGRYRYRGRGRRRKSRLSV